MMSKRLRNFVFTINNYTDSSEQMLKCLYDEKCKYLVYGYEVGGSGTKHLQGYGEINGQITFDKLKKYIPRAHIEPRKGTAKQASEYCKKDGDFVEYGLLSNQGNRTDLENVAELCKEGKSVRAIADAYPVTYIKYHRGVRDLCNIISSVRAWETKVIWCYGGTGTGKTRFFYDNYPDDRWIWSPQMGTWFDGYDGQANVLFDDYRGEFPYGMLLTLLDRYECKVQIKGGMVQFKPKVIFITSPLRPYEIYKCLNNGDSIDQLYRRITQEMHFT